MPSIHSQAASFVSHASTAGEAELFAEFDGVYMAGCGTEVENVVAVEEALGGECGDGEAEERMRERRRGVVLERQEGVVGGDKGKGKKKEEKEKEKDKSGPGKLWKKLKMWVRMVVRLNKRPQ
jgi:hypothetical protein